MIMRRLCLLLVSAVSAVTAGCFSIGLGGEGTALAQYRLEDLSPKQQARATPIDSGC